VWAYRSGAVDLNLNGLSLYVLGSQYARVVAGPRHHQASAAPGL
jgi:hypothetical protein